MLLRGRKGPRSDRRMPPQIVRARFIASAPRPRRTPTSAWPSSSWSARAGWSNRVDVFVFSTSLTRAGPRAIQSERPTAAPHALGRRGHQGARPAPSGCSAPPAKFEEGGSLTVIGTAADRDRAAHGRRIFQEFKGTGNMELVAHRQLADRRIYPAIDLPPVGRTARKSGSWTRRYTSR